jgi:hypothetical protein
VQDNIVLDERLMALDPNGLMPSTFDDVVMDPGTSLEDPKAFYDAETYFIESDFDCARRPQNLCPRSVEDFGVLESPLFDKDAAILARTGAIALSAKDDCLTTATQRVEYSLPAIERNGIRSPTDPIGEVIVFAGPS